MPRSHPPTVLKLACKHVPRGGVVLCAVSGGPDSTCLLHVLSLLRSKRGHTLIAAGVDHGLRAEAAAELDGAQALCDELEVPFHRLHVEVAAGSNLQARARKARHAALQQLAADLAADTLALGHTADDRAETVLLRLLRGAGPKGLAAMPAQAPGVEGPCPIIRPLLAARRSAVLAHLARHRVAYASDPSNEDRRFARVRVRHELMPLLEELSPQIVPHLCSLADMLNREGHGPGGMQSPFEGLGRAQRSELERAIEQGLRGRTGGITLRLRGGREMVLQFNKRKS